MIRSVHDDRIPREVDPGTKLPIGARLDGPGPERPSERTVFGGRYARLEPPDPVRHRDELYASTSPDAPVRLR